MSWVNSLSRKAKIFLEEARPLPRDHVRADLILGNEGKNEEFQPQNEFKSSRIEIDIAGIDFSINKAVLYLFIASALTMATMT